MEIIIVVCLVISIFLFVQDKIASKKRSKQKSSQVNVNFNLPDIMGQPKPKRSLSMPSTDSERHTKEVKVNTDDLDIEYDDNEEVDIQILKEDLDEVFSDLPDFEGEEEEWTRYGIIGSDDSLAQGVTFEELSSVGMLLQKDTLELSQKQMAVTIVQKIQGTELFNLLENSMEGASKKIAALLDSRLSSNSETVSSVLWKNDSEDFDIGEFV